MTTVHHVFVGAVKSAEGGKGGVFRQALGSQRWEALDNGVPADAEVHAITVDPNMTDTVMIATTKGAFRSKNRGDKWERLALPDQGTDIWSITVHPTDPRDDLCRLRADRRLSQRRWRRPLEETARSEIAEPGAYELSVPGHAARCRSGAAG